MKRILITGLCMMFGGSVFGNDVPPLPSNPEKTQSSEVACSPVANGEDSAARLPQNEQSPNDTSVDALKQEQQQIDDSDSDSDSDSDYDYDSDSDSDFNHGYSSYFEYNYHRRAARAREIADCEKDSDNIGRLEEERSATEAEIKRLESSIRYLQENIKYCTESIPFMQTHLSFYRANPKPETQFGDAIITRWLEGQLAFHTEAIPRAQAEIKVYEKKLPELRSKYYKLDHKVERVYAFETIKKTEQRLANAAGNARRVRQLQQNLNLWWHEFDRYRH